MIDWLVHKLFWWAPLRKAIFEEVHMYDHLSDVFTNSDLTDIASCSWMEGDTWYGWEYDSELNRYYFNDIGNKSLVGLWEDNWLKEAGSR
jgi:hypothetical protein